MDIPIIQKMPLGEETHLETLSPKQLGLLASALVIIGALSWWGTGLAPQPSGDTLVAAAASAFADIDVEAKAAIVVDLASGETLFEKNPDIQLPLASLTKVALVLATGDALPRDATVTIPKDIILAGNKARLQSEAAWTVADVIDFMLVTSSNEGAAWLAEYADSALRARDPGLPEGTAALARMNALARELGLASTYFLNVNGLDESTTQSGGYGSARDASALFAYALRTAPQLFSGTARNGLLLTSLNGAQTSASNTNEAQGAISGLIMGKTGYTDLAGGNLGVVFDVGIGHPVVVIVLGSSYEGRFTDIETLTRAAREDITRVASKGLPEEVVK